METCCLGNVFAKVTTNILKMYANVSFIYGCQENQPEFEIVLIYSVLDTSHTAELLEQEHNMAPKCHSPL